MVKKLKEFRQMIYEKNENISKEIEIIFLKNQTEISELKNTALH